MPRALRDEILAHARAVAPEEACGLVAGRHLRATRVIRVANVASDPRRHYRMDPDEQRRALSSMEDAGETDAEGVAGEPLAVYHSHPESHAMPSPTDVADAQWPYSFYVLASLRHAPEIAAYRITGGVVHKADLSE